MLSHAEHLRNEVASQTPRQHKSAMGQFMTPAPVAAFMARMIRTSTGPFRLLDPGAGLGALTCAALDRWARGELGAGAMTVEAYELDERLRIHLQTTLAAYAERHGANVCVAGGDYLAAAADAIDKKIAPFTHAILNPPYKKISSDSDARIYARRAGLETVNLYSAFVGMALEQLRPGGQLVAIIPRSFCNGPYYKPFRRFLLERAALHRIHLFDSRTQAFKDDDVLQENVIVMLERNGTQGNVEVTVSTDDSFADIRTQSVPFIQIVKADDSEYFIHVPNGVEVDAIDAAPMIRTTLKDLGVTVSTGPVVDFRMREHLANMPTLTSVPLLYPVHFSGSAMVWPVANTKKPNAIERNAETERWLYPSGTYTVVRRFSSKEERRRVVASLVTPEALGAPGMIGFENHLNVFHQDRGGLPEDLAWGLFVYLNSTAVDQHFRRFNGHTQVNATDIRNIRFPDRAVLSSLGKWARKHGSPNQSEIDARMEAILK